jgi:hypothetical protein
MLSAVSSDFNGDGFSDLATGVIFEDIPDAVDLNGKTEAGAVNVIYGGSGGLSAEGNQFWTQDSPGINGVAGSYEQFGQVLAAGDFNGDGFADLAINTSFDKVNGVANAGSVNVIYGSAVGLRAKNDQLWNVDSPGIDGRQSYRFGHALSAGDFNGDGIDDLAVGSPWKQVHGVGAGTVSVIFGSADGLTARNDQLWHQDVAGIDGINEDDDQFGLSLAVADFNGDGVDDLAVGAANEANGTGKVRGALHIIFGSTSGLTSQGDQLFRQRGGAIAVGNFNGDRFADLAVSAPDRGLVDNELIDGRVYVSFVGRRGFDDSKTHSYTAIELDVSTFYYGTIGVDLVAGDFDGDGLDDLGISTRRGADGNYWNLGKVLVLPGTSAGFDSHSVQEWSREVEGLLGGISYYQTFGSVLLTGDYDGNGYSDLAVGNWQDVDAFDGGATPYSCGTLQIIYGSEAGLTVANNQLWSQDSPGILDECELNDHFGLALG